MWKSFVKFSWQFLYVHDTFQGFNKYGITPSLMAKRFDLEMEFVNGFERAVLASRKFRFQAF